MARMTIIERLEHIGRGKDLDLVGIVMADAIAEIRLLHKQLKEANRLLKAAKSQHEDCSVCGGTGEVAGPGIQCNTCFGAGKIFRPAPLVRRTIDG